jgi:hypothetical protein
MPPMVRRNLFTIAAVVDPIDGSDNIGINLAAQLMQNSFPARLGVILVNQHEVLQCGQWLAANKDNTKEMSCPVQPLFAAKSKLTLETSSDIKATAHSFFVLFQNFIETYGKSMGASGAYLEYILGAFAQHKETQGDLSVYDMCKIHGDLMEGMQVMTSQQAMRKAFDNLVRYDVHTKAEFSYAKALQFAAEKGLRAGMSFLNGRPLPSSQEDAEAIRTTFSEEQAHVFGLIMKGDINDTGPKSVYGYLLTGDRVFDRFHPLLVRKGDLSDAYVEPAHDLGSESLLEPASTSKQETKFVIEGVFNFSTPSGFKVSLAFLDTLDSFPAFIKAGGGESAVDLQYRVMSRGDSEMETALCPIFSNAKLLGVAKVRSFLVKASEIVGRVSVEDLLASAADTPDQIRDRILRAKEACATPTYTKASLASNYMLANGRIFTFEDNVLSKEDLELILSIEHARAKAVTSLLGDESSHDSVFKVAAFLAVAEVATKRVDVNTYLDSLTDPLVGAESPLRFSWEPKKDSLDVYVTAILDPVSESAQRLSSILMIMRNQLDVRVSLVLTPATSIDKDSKVPIASYYRFVAGANVLSKYDEPQARFTNLPTNHLLTLRMDVPEPWNVQQSAGVQDTDNLRCDIEAGCSDDVYLVEKTKVSSLQQRQVTRVEYDLKSLLIFGQCYEASGKPPNGLQLVLSKKTIGGEDAFFDLSTGVELGMDGSVEGQRVVIANSAKPHSDTLVMKNVGYWQVHAAPGVWTLQIAQGSKGAEMFDIVSGTFRGGRLVEDEEEIDKYAKTIVLQDFVNKGKLLIVKRRSGFEQANLYDDDETIGSDEDVINVFSLATGHLYERFLKIMMLSVTKRTSSKVRFWLFENFLSPSFKASATAMAEQIGSEVKFVTYKWPEWLRGQSEKQRIIWGYKILFLDVLFPLSVKKIIYVDADQVVRGDLKELWDMDLKGAAYGYTPMCSSREATLGFQFWNDGFWKTHLRGKPYHISALYVVDLEKFRRTHVGDTLRSIYQQLSADPNSLANLDQDLPNYAQHQVPIFSLPQEWLWCESWCSDETKSASKTIDLCNNPLHKEAKLTMAKRVISGPLFNESWVELDEEVDRYNEAYKESTAAT